MKTCTECSMPAPAISLQCGHCGSATFTEDAGLHGVREREGRASYWSVLTWGTGYFLVSVVVSVAATMAAQALAGVGLVPAAQGLALAPSVFRPLITVLFFAYFAAGRTAPIAHSLALLLLITLGGFGLHLASSAPLQAFLSHALGTCFFAALGTAIGLFFHRGARRA